MSRLQYPCKLYPSVKFLSSWSEQIIMIIQEQIVLTRSYQCLSDVKRLVWLKMIKNFNAQIIFDSNNLLFKILEKLTFSTQDTQLPLNIFIF